MEEQVGLIWHRWIERLADARHSQAAIRLEQVQKPLAIYFRALGGDRGLAIEQVEPSAWQSRRRWLQRIAGSGKQVELAWLNERALYLPKELAIFSEPSLNRDLYFWLAALATVPHEAGLPWIVRSQRAVKQTLQLHPGLAQRYTNLVQAHIKQRRDPDKLDEHGATAERMIRTALRQPHARLFPLTLKTTPDPVPLWLHPEPPTQADTRKPSDSNDGPQSEGQQKQLDDMARRRAERVEAPEQGRGLVVLRMENILSWGEFVRLDRDTDDEEDLDQAESAARDMDCISVAQQRRAAASRLKFDLELPAEADDDLILSDGEYLPEWDWQKRVLQENHCHVVELVDADGASTALPSHLSDTAKRLRQQFQTLVQTRAWQMAQQDGDEVDLEAYLRFACDRVAHHKTTADRLYKSKLPGGRDLSTVLMADLSMSTDTYVDNENKVIDVIRDSLYLFSESLAATGDDFGVYGFSSRKRDPVRIHRIKAFEETYNSQIRGRISAVKPGYFTRMGCAIRFAKEQLKHRPANRRLLLLLTDGKPNDLDKYEGRYGIEDTRRAVHEARQSGLHPFCVTIDRKANHYLPYLFGAQGYVLIRHPQELPRRLPLMYAALTQA